MKRFALAVALAAVATPALAAPHCITPREVRALIGATLPTVVDAAVKRCRPLLPADAYLATAGDALQRRYAGGVIDAEALRSALSAFVGLPMPAEVSPDMLDTLVRQEMIKSFKIDGMTADDCLSASRILEPMDPLPRDNVERLLVAVMAAVVRKDRQLTVCETPR